MVVEGDLPFVKFCVGLIFSLQLYHCFSIINKNFESLCFSFLSSSRLF